MTYDPMDVLLYIKVTRKDGVEYHQIIGLRDYPGWIADKLIKVEVLRVATSSTQMKSFIKSTEFHTKRGEELDQHRPGTPKWRKRTLG